MKAEAELQEKLRLEKLNAELDEKHRQKQEEANKRFEEAKARLEESGAEFVSNEEFNKIKSAQADKAAGAA